MASGDPFFANLTKRQAMLLLVACTFGGQEGVEALEFLSEDEAEALGERAARLMSVSREKRVPFMVQEIKRLVVGRKGGDLRGAAPMQVAGALKGERPALAEVILRALPGSLADQVRDELPPSNVTLTREVKPEVLSIIRWHFEAALRRLQPRGASFMFTDLLQLTPRDLLTLSDHLGATELGAAIAGLPQQAKDELLKALPAEQRTLALQAAQAAGSPMDEADAHERIEAVSPGEPRFALRQAGMLRLIRACLGESAEFASKLAERHRDDLGRLLISAIRTERASKAKGLDKLKAEVVAKLELLAERGLVDRPVRLAPPPGMSRRPQGEVPPGTLSSPKLPVPQPPRPRPSRDAEPTAEPAAEVPRKRRTYEPTPAVDDPPRPRRSVEQPSSPSEPPVRRPSSDATPRSQPALDPEPPRKRRTYEPTPAVEVRPRRSGEAPAQEPPPLPRKRPTNDPAMPEAPRRQSVPEAPRRTNRASEMRAVKLPATDRDRDDTD